MKYLILNVQKDPQVNWQGAKLKKKSRNQSIGNLSAVDEDIKLNILLAMGGNPYNRVRQVGRDFFYVCPDSIKTRKKWDPFEIRV